MDSSSIGGLDLAHAHSYSEPSQPRSPRHLVVAHAKTTPLLGGAGTDGAKKLASTGDVSFVGDLLERHHLQLLERKRMSRWNAAENTGMASRDFDPRTVSGSRVPIRRAVDVVKATNRRMRSQGRRARWSIAWLYTWFQSDCGRVSWSCWVLLNAVFIGYDVSRSAKEIPCKGTDATDPSHQHCEFDNAFYFRYMLRALFFIPFFVELLVFLSVEGREYISSNVPMRFVDFCVNGLVGTDICFLTPLMIWDSADGDTSKALLEVTAFLRMARVMTMTRLLEQFARLGLISMCMYRSVVAVGWVLVFVGLFVYMCALGCLVMHGPSASTDEGAVQYFDSLRNSLFTHAAMIVGTRDMAIVLSAFENTGSSAATWGWRFYFSVFALLFKVVLLSLVTALIVDVALEEQSNSALEESMDPVKFTVLMHRIFAAEDTDFTGKIDAKAWCNMFRHPEILVALQCLDISMNMDLDTWVGIFNDMDFMHGVGQVDFGQVISAFMKLRGCKSNFHGVLLQQDMQQRFRHLLEELPDSIAAAVCDGVRSDIVDAVRRGLERDDLQRSMLQAEIKCAVLEALDLCSVSEAKRADQAAAPHWATSVVAELSKGGVQSHRTRVEHTELPVFDREGPDIFRFFATEMVALQQGFDERFASLDRKLDVLISQSSANA
mmetsp:Transcript_127579/g.291610  ORF Transcript_127579/g.291610 Transcript_127579/m.291610 type:complete len:663 (+) Transcript_127579:108-2096(+)